SSLVSRGERAVSGIYEGDTVTASTVSRRSGSHLHPPTLLGGANSDGGGVTGAWRLPSRCPEVRPQASAPCQAAQLLDRATDDGRLEKLLRDDGARAGAETGAGPGARTDVPEPVDRRHVPAAAGERPPQEVLVERQRAAVRVAPPEIHVHPLEVVRPERNPLHDRRLEIRHVPGEAGLEPIGVPLSLLVVPLQPRRELLQLDPQQSFPLGS